MQRALIVYEQESSREALRQLLPHLPVTLAGEAALGLEAERQIVAGHYDVLFLCPATCGQNVLELARKYRERSRTSPVIFVAPHRDLAACAFEVGAVDYLLLPLQKARVAQALDRASLVASAARRTSPPALARLPVPQDGKTTLLNPADIAFAYTEGEQVYLKLHRHRMPCAYTVRQLEERLAPHGFLRTHRGFVANLGHVREVVHYFKGALGLIMADHDQTEVPVSRAMAPQVKSYMGL